MAKKKEKAKLFELDSKQIKESKSKSETVAKDQRSAEQELASIRSANDANMGSIVKLSGSLRKTLDTGKLALPEAGILNGKDRLTVDNSNILEILGKFKNREEAEDVITAKIENATAQVSLYNHTGVYAKMMEARRANFMEDNLPVLRTSLELFVDDVNNGAFRGSEYGNHNKFRFYENGSLITDMNRIKKMTEYLNPTTYNKLKDDVKTFDEVDSTGDYLAYKYGNSDTRLISHKDVAKDMYIKYVLKEAKKKTMAGAEFIKERALVASSESSLESINEYITSKYNSKPMTMKSNLLTELSMDIISEIPEEFLESTEIFRGVRGNESVDMDRYAYNEFTTNESFLDFAERYLYGKASRVYNVNPRQDREEVIDGYCFTYESSGYTNEVAQAILADLTLEYYGFQDSISTESIGLGIESFMQTDEKLVTMMLQTVSFDDIYGTSADRILTYNKKNIKTDNYGLETYSAVPDTAMLKVKGGTMVDRLYIKAFNSLNRNTEVSMEGYGEIADTSLNPSYGVQELGGVPLDKKNSGAKGTTDKVEASVKNKKVNYNKLEKMFGNIRGCTVEYLDNTRKIPLVAGNKKIGDFYIEYTHQDIQHFIGLRTILGNPVSYTQNMDMLNVRTDEQEETLGRLIFSDTIKPLLEQNVDTKFIRNNSNVLYALQKLMEENELSQSMTYSDLTRYSMYNLSRIIFIPASQVIFKKNGEGALGESRFIQATVPATSYILAREAYLSWILADAKGISFLTLPKGMSDMGGEYGQDHLKDKIDDLNVSRAKLRDIAFNNTPLTHRFVVLEKDEEVNGDIDIKTIEYPDFRIDQDTMSGWLNDATAIVGVSAALFMNNNNEVELMHKLSHINDKDLIRVLKCRAQKKVASSQLATRLLQLRGGSEFNDVQVEWVEPSINAYNHVNRTEMLDQLSGLIEKYVGIYDMVYEDDDNYKAAKGLVVKEILSKLTDSDTLLLTMDDIVKEAVQKFMVNMTEEVEEKKLDKENEKNTEENSDQDNEYNPDNVNEDMDNAGVDNADNPFA